MAHDGVLGDDCVVGDKVLLAGHVRVETGAVLGARSGVHQFATIGRLSAVGRAAPVNQDVPPFTRIDDSASEIGGINEEGLRSKGVLEATVAALMEAYRIVWQEGLPKPEALARVEQSLSHVPLVLELVAFLKASDRGRMGRGRDAAPPANHPKG